MITLRNPSARVSSWRASALRCAGAAWTASLQTGRRSAPTCSTAGFWTSAGALLTCAAAGIALMLRGNERNRQLSRQSANDQLSATVAGLLLAPDGEDADARIAQVLKRLAAHAGTARVLLALGDQSPPRVVAWPSVADDAARRFAELVEEARVAPGWNQDLLALPSAPGGQGHLLFLRDRKTAWAVLGIEADASVAARRTEAIAGLRMAMAALVQAVRREGEAAERVVLERRLAEAERLELIGTIASGVAHNFNNIVGAIGGFSEMARSCVRRGSAVAGHLDEIGQAVMRAQTLIEDILGFAGRRAAATCRINLTALLEETAGLLRASYPEDTTIIVRADDPAEGSVNRWTDAADDTLGNAARLQQVFMNICNNARAAAGNQTSMTLTLSRRTFERAARLSHGPIAAGEYAVVAVDDSGPGVPAAVFPRLFEPFYHHPPRRHRPWPLDCLADRARPRRHHQRRPAIRRQLVRGLAAAGTAQERRRAALGRQWRAHPAVDHRGSRG